MKYTGNINISLFHKLFKLIVYIFQLRVSKIDHFLVLKLLFRSIIDPDLLAFYKNLRVVREPQNIIKYD